MSRRRPLVVMRFSLAALAACCVVGCATASNEPSMDYEERSRRESYGGADAPVAEMAAAPSPMSSIGDGLSNFFGGQDKSAQAPPSGAPTMTTPPTDAPLLPKTEPESKPLEAARRLVIYTGSMALMVPTADVALATFVDSVTAMGGYLQTRSKTTVTVRVPAAQFFTVVEGLRKVGTVTDEQINAQDVTKRVFDIELRLQNAEESRKRLVDILKSASKIEDILRIESEIRRLTDEIEAMKGELRNLGDQVAFSTLTVSFFANAPSPRPYPDRTRSRFEWINEIGVEQVLYGF